MIGDSMRNIENKFRLFSKNGLRIPSKQPKNRAQLPDKMRQALVFIAENKRANIYQVKENCAMGYSTAHSSIKTLETEGSIRLLSEEKNSKGVMAKIYGITLKGLYQAIYVKSSWEEKVALIEKRKDLVHENFITWMKFIGAFNISEIENEINNRIADEANVSFLFEIPFYNHYYPDLDDALFDLTILTKLIVEPGFLDVFLVKISNFPSIRTKIEKQILLYLEHYQNDLRKLEVIRGALEKGS
jgi:hypothetical protein